MPEIVPTTKNVLIVAGDPSGDLHGANLIKALKELDPEINVAALGGRRMQPLCDRFIYNLVGVGAGGFAEPLRRFFLWIRLIALVRKYLDEKRPACVIAIDFYGFNHQVLGLAAHRKIPAFYYISPQVWASRPGRAAKLARLVRQMLVIFPFEEEIYRKHGADCAFVGHPLLDIIPASAEPPAGRGTDYAWKIGLLPGSRPAEVERLMPIFWQSFLRVKQGFPNSEAHVFAAREISDETINALCRAATPDGARFPGVKIIREEDYSVRAVMDVAVTASGTATLENALLGLPMVVAYKVSWFTYQIAKRLITVPYISLVNILAKKQLVREYVQDDASPDAISGQLMSLLQNPDKLNGQRKELLALRNSLGQPGASKRAAQLIIAKAMSGVSA